MMMVRIVGVGLLCFAAMWLLPEVLADARICTKKEAKAAETASATARSWRQLYQLFERYSYCDDGAIAEGFSESVTLLLAEQWWNIRQFETVLRRDSAFREFVIRHIDETIPTERLNHIAGNANKRCPRSLKSLCLDIEAAAKKSAQT
jgi:hypothetical protein